MLMSEVLKRVRKVIQFFCALIYALFLPVLQNKPRRVILSYHGVRKQDVKKFQEQMAYLANRCKVVKPSEIKTVIAKDSDVLVAITFDDAFVSVTENAVPILKEYGLPAGIFVPAGNLNQKPRWEMSEDCPDKNEVVMNKEQIVGLDKEGFEIFSHALSHPVLTEIEDDRLQAELVESKQELERIVNHEVVGISYPHGDYDTGVCKAAQKAGYKLGFTIEPRIVEGSTDNMQTGRFLVSPSDGLIKFKLKAIGAYEAAKYLGTIKTLLKNCLPGRS